MGIPNSDSMMLSFFGFFTLFPRLRLEIKFIATLTLTTCRLQSSSAFFFLLFRELRWRGIRSFDLRSHRPCLDLAWI